MTGAALKKKLISIYGKEFHAPVAAEAEVDKSTVYRWVAADRVPGLVVAWITEKMAARKTAEPAHSPDRRRSYGGSVE